MNISVVIPAYKKEDMLFRNLSHNLPYLQGCEIIVVNDYPEKSIKKEMCAGFPNVILIENDTNDGFGGAVNKGVSYASHPYVLLLNSDVVLCDTSYLLARDHFVKNKALFAVSFAQKEKDGSIVGKNVLYWHKGFMLHRKADDLSFGANGWAEAGTCMVDKKKYQHIGGFDMIYAPFYWEDIDLSYRAKKAGYEVVFDPQIMVEHHHESTIGSCFEKEYVKTIAYRNQFLFVWRNIRDVKLVVSHVVWLIPHIIVMLLRGEQAFLKGFIQGTVIIYLNPLLQRFYFSKRIL